MRNIIHKIKLWLLFFSGEDRYMIDQCKNKKINWAFIKIGLLVASIFMGCFVSATSFIIHVLDNFFLSVPIGIFWAFIVTNLFVLLLYTISPEILPKRKVEMDNGNRLEVNDAIRKKNIFSFSMIFRIGLMLTLAIIIAQPLNVLVLSPFAKNSLATFKIDYRINSIIAADSNIIRKESQERGALNLSKNSLNDNDNIIYSKIEIKIVDDEQFLYKSKALLDTLKKWDNFSFVNKKYKYDSVRILLNELIDEEIQSDINFVSQRDTLSASNTLVQSFVQHIVESIQSKVDNYNSLTNLLQKSDFYVTQIKILLKENPFAWMITVFMCFLFLMPIRWKYQIRKTENFYDIKKRIEKKIIEEEYIAMKKEYEIIFSKKFNEYNFRTLEKMLPLLEKLKDISPSKYEIIKQEIEYELKDIHIVKYEYWADAPFRTKKIVEYNNLTNESNFITKIYN